MPFGVGLCVMAGDGSDGDSGRRTKTEWPKTEWPETEWPETEVTETEVTETDGLG